MDVFAWAVRNKPRFFKCQIHDPCLAECFNEHCSSLELLKSLKSHIFSLQTEEHPHLKLEQCNNVPQMFKCFHHLPIGIPYSIHSMPRMVSVLQLIAETLDVGKNDGIPWTQFQKAD